MNVYQQMLEVAVANRLPSSFQNDLLVHDKGALEDNPGQPFYWLLYDNGTHLVWADQKDPFHVLRMLRTICECFTDGRSHREDGTLPYKWFYCDGQDLHCLLQNEVIKQARDAWEASCCTS